MHYREVTAQRLTGTTEEMEMEMSILMRVILVSAVVLVHGIVDLRSVVCFTVCMFYFSKKKTPGVETLKDSCRDCLVL